MTGPNHLPLALMLVLTAVTSAANGDALTRGSPSGAIAV